MNAVRVDEELTVLQDHSKCKAGMWTVTRSDQPASRGSDEIGIELCQCWSDTQLRDT